MTTLVNIRNLKNMSEWLKNPCNYYIGKSCIIVGSNGTKKTLPSSEYYITNGNFKDINIDKLIGKVLGCRCKDPELCHGKIILNLISYSSVRGNSSNIEGNSSNIGEDYLLVKETLKLNLNSKESKVLDTESKVLDTESKILDIDIQKLDINFQKVKIEYIEKPNRKRYIYSIISEEEVEEYSRKGLKLNLDQDPRWNIYFWNTNGRTYEEEMALVDIEREKKNTI